MKIQCSCGAKYEFEVNADMVHRPFQFICPACGLDSSAYVAALVRQEFGGGAGEGTCAKHPGEEVVEKCVVCSKPICRKCMELFGYVCSPLCRARSASLGIAVPVFKGQKSVREAKRWQFVSRLGLAALVLVLAGLGFWFWYVWFGSEPKPVFSVRFEEPAYSGQSTLSGKDQVVFLHGGTLARYDLATKRRIWSRELVDKKQVAQAVERELKSMKAIIDRANNVDPEHTLKMPAPDKLTATMERQAASELELRVYGRNIWINSPGKLVRYDWATGMPAQEISFDENFGPTTRGEEMLLLKEGAPAPTLTRVNLVSGESHPENLGFPTLAADGGGKTAGKLKSANAKPGAGSSAAGLPVGMPGKEGGKAMDPAKVTEQAQHLPLAARLALPALLAGNANQERTLAELNDNAPTSSRSDVPALRSMDYSSLVPTRDGFVQFSVKLLEERRVSHTAMKAKSGKSALEGAVTVAKTTEIANEILNDMQRSRGGDVVVEDQSRYLVSLSRPGGQDTWNGEVVGPPQLHVLQTKRVLSAGKSLVVFDSSNRKLWQSTLNYELGGGQFGTTEEGGPYGRGPVVEHKDGLFVFDQGVLSAFDLATGNARWRLPSVGVAGIFFDDRDMLYVNTTTASPEKIKYSRQIDISQKATSIVQKVDSRSGKVLWTAEPGGLVTHVEGQHVFAVQSFQPPEEEDNPYTPDTGFETPPYLRIKRLNPKNGRPLWEHFQQRAPLDVRFEANTIELVFKKEVQVLRFLDLSRSR